MINIEFKDLKNKIEELSARIKNAGALIRVGEKKEKLAKLEAEISKESFWNDSDNARQVSKEADAVKTELETFSALQKEMDDAVTYYEMALEENSETEMGEISSFLIKIENELKEIEFKNKTFRPG